VEEMILSAYEVLNKISEAIMQFMTTIGEADWLAILEVVKNLAVGGGTGGLVYAVFRYVLPLLKNSNKPILAEIAAQGLIIVTLIDEIKQLKEENATIKQVGIHTLHYLETSANVNLTSKTLSPEQKASYLQWIAFAKTLNITEATKVAEEIEQAIADDKLTVEEAITISQNIKAVNDLVLTPLSQIGVQ
jgi:hypothetical protein